MIIMGLIVMGLILMDLRLMGMKTKPAKLLDASIESFVPPPSPPPSPSSRLNQISHIQKKIKHSY